MNQPDADPLAAALNEWMRRYTEDPAAFQAEFQTVALFQAERLGGRTPSYGETCAAYLAALIAETSGATLGWIRPEDIAQEGERPVTRSERYAEALASPEGWFTPGGGRSTRARRFARVSSRDRAIS